MDKKTIEFIGKDKYIELLKKYNLCTKKWTYGRTKEFYKEVNKIIKAKTKEELEKMRLECEDLEQLGW